MDVREDDLLALVPEGVYVDGKVQTGQAVTIRDGRIVQVGAIPDGADVLRLPNRLLVPGLVNAHSHAFQRAIRGRTESREPGRESDDFWSWRERMYHAALRLDPDDLEAVSRMAFLEMVLSGITAVGEFHYLHHPAEGGRYADPDELALRVFHAAKTVGIRIVLLRVGYARAGHDRPAHPRQMRFVDERVEDVIEAADRLAARGIAVGLAPHSVRALPLPWIRAMAEHARRNGWPLHMHVSEQPREIEQCLAEHGLRPVALLDREGLVDERFTGVHAIHLAPEEIEALGRARANVCACPTTERNLGDGIVPARELFALGATISFGTDSQVEIAPLQDARSLEYHLRLQGLERAVLAPEGRGEADALANRLLDAATIGGARSLGLDDAGRLAPGASADFFAVDLDDPSVCGSDPATWIPNLVFSAERTAIRDVWVAGERIVKDGSHPLQREIVDAFQRVMRRLWA
ncbi:MAG TPA: formimidoylglutamate deiminase [Fredinandcohnia sp.]|nr:formimidoylglutamate deiminase [Fredinandcohnia sp.]